MAYLQLTDLRKSFGATVADAAHAGMIQRVRVDQLFTPGETGRCAARSMRWTCGWMWLAGATEMWRRTPTAVTRLSQERREALMALALQLRCPFGEADGKTHEWPWLDALSRTLPQRGAHVLFDMLRPQLERLSI